MIRLHHSISLITVVGLFLSAYSTLRAELRITELMQSNVVSYLEPISSDFPDSWVELYNDSEEEIDLTGYAIGIKEKYTKAYNLPQYNLEAHEYLLIYCDKEDDGLHTDFRLESDKKGSVYLFKNQQIIDQVSFPPFPAPDISYGTDSIGNTWGYMLTPTPAAENTGDIVTSEFLLGDPVFSNAGCVYPEFSSVTISLPEDAPEGTVIRYTLDGSLPTTDSDILENGGELNFENENTIVRARLFKEGYLSPMPVTHSYITPLPDSCMPVISIVTDDCYLFDPKIGLLYHNNRYREWRRPINFEYFDTDSRQADINQICETRIGGNSSRNMFLKPLMVYANKRFGASKLYHEFFPDQKPGLAQFKSIYLRNSGNDYHETYVRDAVAQMSIGMHTDIDWQAVKPTIVYVNGKFHGILNLRERSNDDYVWANYDGLEDIDMVENFSELKTGDLDSFNSLVEFYNEEGHTSEEYAGLIDIREIMDIHLANMFFNNTDFPGNNMILWRPTEDGGLWRVIMKDADYAMGIKYAFQDTQLNPTFNTVEWFNTPGYDGGGNTWGNNPSRTLLFRRLMELDDIRESFLERSFIYMGDFLNEETVLERIDYMDRQIEPVWEYHAALNLQDNEYGTRDENMEWMRGWISARRPLFASMLADYYNLGPLINLTIEIVDECFNPGLTDDVRLTLNGETLKTRKFNGQWPISRGIELSVSGLEANCTWEIESDIVMTEFHGPDLTLTIPDPSDFTIRLKSALTQLPVIEKTEDNGRKEYYDLMGNRVRGNIKDFPGILIEKSSAGIRKKIIR